jgi:hypothetical protein
MEAKGGKGSQKASNEEQKRKSDEKGMEKHAD